MDTTGWFWWAVLTAAGIVLLAWDALFPPAPPPNNPLSGPEETP